MVQQSWNFANDSYYTNLCLQWEPQIIAICMIYLAGKIQKVSALSLGFSNNVKVFCV